MVRLWQHELEEDFDLSIGRIVSTIGRAEHESKLEHDELPSYWILRKRVGDPAQIPHGRGTTFALGKNRHSTVNTCSRAL